MRKIEITAKKIRGFEFAIMVSATIWGEKVGGFLFSGEGKWVFGGREKWESRGS